MTEEVLLQEDESPEPLVFEEEGLVEVPKEESAEEEVTEVVAEEVNEVEQEAVKKGWKPDGPKSAEEFLRAEPLYEEIKARGREIKDLRVTLEELTSHMKKQQEIGYQKALHELKAERVEAIQEGDVEKVESLERQIKDTETGIEEATKPQEHPSVTSFYERHNSWWSDPSYEAQEMRDFAAKRDIELSSQGLSPDTIIETLESDLRYKFPKKFENKAQEEPMVVESNTREVRSEPSTLRFSELSTTEKQLYRFLQDNNPMEAKEYLKELKKMRETK